jgi:bacteriocin-like protein
MIPTEIIPVTELTDTELDAVSGGLLDNLNLNLAPQLNLNITTPQINVGAPTAVAVAALGAAAAIQQALGQGNSA